MLLGLVLVLKKEKYGWLVLSLSTAGLLLSHNLISMIFLPFFALFALGLIMYKKAWKQAITAFFSGLLGVGIASFYVLPAFFEKSATQVEGRILTHYFDFHLHFLYLRQFVTPYWGYGGSVWGPNDDISFFLGYGMLAGLLLTGAALLQNFRQKKKLARPFVLLSILSFILGSLALFMTTEKTLILWEQISLLKFVQFPWRFLSVAIIFISLAITSGIVSLSSKLVKFALTGVVFAILLSNARYFRPEAYLDSPQELYSAEESQVAQKMSGILPDFLPQGFDEEALPVNLSQVVVSPELTDSSVLVNRVQEKLVFVEFSDPTDLVFALADFPGWQVEIDGEQVNHGKTTEGLLSVLVPAGSHQIGVRFLPTLVRAWANGISAASLFILFALLLYLEKKK